MELNDLKTIWNQAAQSDQPTQEPMPYLQAASHDQFQSRINRITASELAGSFVCIGLIPLIGWQLSSLNPGVYWWIAVAAMLLLLSIACLSTWSVFLLRSGINLSNSYAHVLNEFAKRRFRFVQLQRYSVFLCYPLLVSSILLLSELSVKKDLMHNAYFWTISISGGYLFLLFFSRWVNRFYSTMLEQAASILRDGQY